MANEFSFSPTVLAAGLVFNSRLSDITSALGKMNRLSGCGTSFGCSDGTHASGWTGWAWPCETREGGTRAGRGSRLMEARSRRILESKESETGVPPFRDSGLTLRRGLVDSPLVNFGGADLDARKASDFVRPWLRSLLVSASGRGKDLEFVSSWITSSGTASRSALSSRMSTARPAPSGKSEVPWTQDVENSKRQLDRLRVQPYP